jgi:hypothetical protein
MDSNDNFKLYRGTLADFQALRAKLKNEMALSDAQAANIAWYLKDLHLPRMSFNELISLARTIHVGEEQSSQLQLAFEKILQAEIEIPPRLAHFALLLVPKRNREHLIGDLEEEFRTVVLPRHGCFLARCWYFEQVALAIGSYLWPMIKKILGLSILHKLIGR